MGKNGWTFSGEGYEGQGQPKGGMPNYTPADKSLYNVEKLSQLYFKAQPDYDARYTVPIIWDKKTETIVNNESSEIIRMMNAEFDSIIDDRYKGIDYYPQELRKEIDSINEWIYDKINNGVYKTGFASTQEAYESNYHPLHEHLQKVEELLKGKDYLVGGKLTEADIRLYTTIIRYDVVYTSHFKCGGQIRHDYPEINRWMKNLYWNNPAFKDTTDFDHIKVRNSNAFVPCINSDYITTDADPLLLESPSDQPYPDCASKSTYLPTKGCTGVLTEMFSLPAWTD